MYIYYAYIYIHIYICLYSLILEVVMQLCTHIASDLVRVMRYWTPTVGQIICGDGWKPYHIWWLQVVENMKYCFKKKHVGVNHQSQIISTFFWVGECWLVMHPVIVIWDFMLWSLYISLLVKISHFQSNDLLHQLSYLHSIRITIWSAYLGGYSHPWTSYD